MSRLSLFLIYALKFFGNERNTKKKLYAIFLMYRLKPFMLRHTRKRPPGKWAKVSMVDMQFWLNNGNKMVFIAMVYIECFLNEVFIIKY